MPVQLAVTNFTAGASGFVGETDKGGAVDNKGGIITPTGDAFPVVTAPTEYQIPLRTPFALTGSATDADGDPLLYSWEQNDRGAAAAARRSSSNTKTNGPLFAMFPKSAIISETDTLLYHSPGENSLTDSPTRVFPDLQQILDNNTNADTGACPTGPIAPPVPVPVKECFAEFLPTADYVGFAGTNAVPLSLHFRLTARDLKGGVNAADTTLLLTPATGPFLVTAPNTAVSYYGGSTQTVTWDVAGTDVAPISATDVKISLSTDGGLTYPTVLAASTPNDGSASVTLPNIGSATARIKVEAVGNVFFDISNADFKILGARAIKQSVLAELQAAGPINKETDKRIAEAASHLAKSINSPAWVDDDHLTKQKSDQVFDQEEEAVRSLAEMKNPSARACRRHRRLDELARDGRSPPRHDRHRRRRQRDGHREGRAGAGEG